MNENGPLMPPPGVPPPGAGTGLRQRVVRNRQLQPQLQNKTQRNRLALFGNRKNKTLTPEQIMLKLEIIQEEQRIATALQRAIAEEAALRGEQSERVEETVEKGFVNTLKGIGQIKQGVGELKNITSETLGTVKRIGRIATFREGSFRDILYNEWVFLIVYFVSHTQFPVTMDTIASVWWLLLSVKYIHEKVKALREKRFIESFIAQGGPIRQVFTMVTSGPHAIFLIYYLSKRFTELRTGGGNATPQNSAAYTAAFNHTFEGTIPQLAQDVIASYRQMNTTAVYETAVETVPTYDEAKVLIKEALERAPHVFDFLQAIDPQLFKDKAGFIHLLAAYIGGEIVNATTKVAVKVAGVPAFTYQLKELANAEMALIGLVMNWVYWATKNNVQILGNQLGKLVCTTLCSIQPEPSSSWFSTSPMDWVRTILGAPYKFVVSAICDCSTGESRYGISSLMNWFPKRNGGSRKKHTRRAKRKIRTQRGGTTELVQQRVEEFNQFVMFMWRASLLYSSPLTREQEKELNTIGMEVIQYIDYNPLVWFDERDELFPRLTNSA